MRATVSYWFENEDWDLTGHVVIFILFLRMVNHIINIILGEIQSNEKNQEKPNFSFEKSLIFRQHSEYKGYFGRDWDGHSFPGHCYGQHF